MSRNFHFEWRTALLAAILLPVMISLGFWQLRRADENRELMRMAEQRRQLPPLALTGSIVGQLGQGTADEKVQRWHLQQVSVQGQWLDRVFLLENQLHEGRNGYHVIGVMRLDEGRHVLVNRGWIVAPALRSDFPVVPATVPAAVESGELYVSSQVLQENPVYAENGWPRRIGKLSVPGLAHELGFDVLPVILRLREGSPSALVTQWPVVNIAPEKNIAYAIQWFAMSVALVLFYLFLSFRRETKSDVINEVTHG